MIAVEAAGAGCRPCATAYSVIVCRRPTIPFKANGGEVRCTPRRLAIQSAPDSAVNI
jgi:hypothetical protein